MIKLSHKNHSVFDDFSDQCGEYSTPAVAIIAFETALEAHDYHLEDYECRDRGSGHDSVILDIYDDCGNHVGLAHIAWSLYYCRYSVLGRIM